MVQIFQHDLMIHQIGTVFYLGNPLSINDLSEFDSYTGLSSNNTNM